jgi:hypothetical protein
MTGCAFVENGKKRRQRKEGRVAAVVAQKLTIANCAPLLHFAAFSTRENLGSYCVACKATSAEALKFRSMPRGRYKLSAAVAPGFVHPLVDELHSIDFKEDKIAAF